MGRVLGAEGEGLELVRDDGECLGSPDHDGTAPGDDRPGVALIPFPHRRGDFTQDQREGPHVPDHLVALHPVQKCERMGAHLGGARIPNQHRLFDAGRWNDPSFLGPAVTRGWLDRGRNDPGKALQDPAKWGQSGV